jgi:phosphoribosylglycinamide formyltransferase-1
LLESYDIEYIILAGFMRVLSPDFVNRFPRKIINIHPADTRLYQGTDGYAWAFNNHIKKTVITIHYVDEGVDTGEIIAQRDVSISHCTSVAEVKAAGIAVENVFYSETLASLFLSRGKK